MIAREQPQWQCVRVDLDAGAEPRSQAAALLQELLHADEEDQVAYRGGKRHAARLVRGGEQSAGGLRVPQGRTACNFASTGCWTSCRRQQLRVRQPAAGEVEIAVMPPG